MLQLHLCDAFEWVIVRGISFLIVFALMKTPHIIQMCEVSFITSQWGLDGIELTEDSPNGAMTG